MIYAIFIFAFLLRILPRLILPFAISDDGYGHFANADNIRKSGFVIPKFYDKTIFPQIFGYPFFFPYYLALFPKKAELIAEIIISPLMDTLIIYISTLLFIDVMGPESKGSLASYSFASLLAVFPVFLRNDTGPRAYHGSARLIGQFFFLLTIFSFYRYVDTLLIHWLFSASLFGSLIFISSTFASQAFVFTGIFLSIIYVQYSIVLVTAFVLFYIMTLGKAHQIVVAQLEHYKWYFKFYQKIHLLKWTHFNNTIGDFLNKWKDLIVLFWNMKYRSFIIYFNIDNNPIHILITSYFCYFFLFVDYPTIESEKLLFLVGISVLVVYILTMHKKLLFLGESYRYLEYGIIYALILFFKNFVSIAGFYYFIWAWIIIAIVRYYFFQLEFYKNYKKSNENYLFYKEFFSKINPIISGNVYASIYFRTKAAYFGNFSYLGNRGFMNLNYLSLEDNYLSFGNYPYPDGNFPLLIERFNIRYWLTTTSDLEKYLPYTINYGDFYSSMELVASDDRIKTLLFKVK